MSFTLSKTAKFKLIVAALASINLIFLALQTWISYCRVSDNIAENYHLAYKQGVESAKIKFFDPKPKLPKAKLQNYRNLSADTIFPSVAFMLLIQLVAMGCLLGLFRIPRFRGMNIGMGQVIVKTVTITTIFYFLIVKLSDFAEIQESGKCWGTLTTYTAFCQRNNNASAVCMNPEVRNMGSMADVFQNDHQANSSLQGFYEPTISMLFGILEALSSIAFYFLNINVVVLSYAKLYDQRIRDEARRPLIAYSVFRNPDRGLSLGVQEGSSTGEIAIAMGSCQPNPATASTSPLLGNER